MNFDENLHFKEFPPITDEEWEKVITKDLKGEDYKELLRWKTPEGVDILPFYRKTDLKNLHHGADPVLKSGHWKILEPVTGPDLKAAIQQALTALKNGADGMVLMVPSTTFGSYQDFKLLFENIELSNISLKIGPALAATAMADWLQQYCSEQQIDSKELDVLWDFDPFAASVLHGSLPAWGEMEAARKSVGEAGVNMAAYANAGATIVQQLAFALASGNQWFAAEANFPPKLFNFAVANSYFPELAKFRAFRLLWEQVLGEYELANHPFYIHSETAMWNKTQNDAHTNMLRTTTETMAAVLGGADAVTVHPYNEHFEKPSEFSRRIARNVQLILREEAYFNKVADVGAGSFYIEKLTDEIAKASWDLFQEIEGRGGFYECLKSGFIQNEIEKSRQARIHSYKEKTEILVGVNKYEPEELIQNYSVTGLFGSGEGIKKIKPFNMEAELLKGDG